METTFYDSKARPVAYTSDGENVFDFDGAPVAHSSGTSRYSYSGHHLGCDLPWMFRTCLAVVLLALCGLGSTWAEELTAVVPCEPAHIDLGEPQSRWAVADGFYGDEREASGRTSVWAQRRSSLQLPLLEQREIRLDFELRPVEDGLELQLIWNGHDLGTRELAPAWQTVSWTIPEPLALPGLNRIDLVSSLTRTPKGGTRHLSVRLDSVTITPASSQCTTHPPFITDQGEPIELPPGGGLVHSGALPPRARLNLRFDSTSAAALRVEQVDRHGRRPLDFPNTGGAASLALPNCCDAASSLVIVNQGKAPVEVQWSITGSQSPLLWSLGCRTTPAAVLLLLATAVLVVLAVRRGLRLPRLPVIVEVGLVFGLALVVRLVLLHYLALRPDEDFTRFGDAWEYLYRASMLMGDASFWGETRWHAWQSWIRPPGYYAFLAAVGRFYPGGLSELAQAQAILSSITAAALYLVAYPLFGRRAARLAGLIAALQPELAVTPLWILSEPLYLALLVPGFAALAWVSANPRPLAGFLAGLGLGGAALVRSEPLYYIPVVAALLVVVHRRKGWKPAVALLIGAACFIATWSVRNTVLYGHRMGIDNIAAPNYLMAHPDERFVSIPPNADLTPPVSTGLYYHRVKWANRGNAMHGRGILVHGVLRLLSRPVSTLENFGRNLKIHFAPYSETYPGYTLGARKRCHIRFLTDYLNGGYLGVLLLGLVGLVLTVRRRAVWPLLLWLPYTTVALNLVFYPSLQPGRYRLSIIPILVVLSAAVLDRALRRFELPSKE